MNNWNLLVEDLWNGDKGICFFVHSGRSFWVADEKFNFSLDAGKDYRAYFDKGHITKEQYDAACSSFREGILNLTANNFLKYLNSKERLILTVQNLKEILEYNILLGVQLHQRIEQYYLSGSELEVSEFAVANVVSSRLPMFYVNFDRDIYMHMDYGRAHEDLAYSGWLAKCADFCYLVPDRERYWVSGAVDFWKYRFL